MTIVFYSAPLSSASPVASALAELGVPHQVVSFDLTKSDHKRPEFLRLNPNAKVPTLVVDGTPMFEALAIQIWLGDRFGVARGLWPAFDDPARMQALAWCSWAYVSYGAVLGRLQYSSSARVDTALHNAPQAELAAQQLQELLGILDAHLQTHDNILGGDFSLADLCVASVVGYSLWIGVSVEKHSHVRRWLDRFQARESYKAVMQPAQTGNTQKGAA